MFSKFCSLLVIFVSALLVASLANAQPPKTRDGGTREGIAGQPEGPQNDQSERAAGAAQEWPKVRTPGSRTQQGIEQPGDDHQYRTEPRQQVRVAPPSQNWFLGINPERAPKGLRVDSVAPGSPAQLVGLETGDYVLDVGGYVIGEYNNQYYPLAMAMDFGVDSSGWGEFLIWNCRTYKEEPMWIQVNRR